MPAHSTTTSGATTTPASGSQALFANTGDNNTASGHEALHLNTQGSQNTASGVGGALYSNTEGGSNTATGYTALFYNTTGSNNTALGYHAGPDSNSTNLTNSTAIGANAEVTQSNSLVLGSISGVNGATADTNVGIGTTAPQYALDVHGTGNFSGLITFASGQTFPGTGSGTVTSVGSGTGLTGGPVTTSGTLSIAPNACGAGNALTALPFTCSPFATLGANTFTGNQTVNGNLSATGLVTGSSFGIGSNLFAFGSYSLGNAFLGFAGNATTTGTSNTASGYQALAANTTGGGNTAIGSYALSANTTAVDNTASGIHALAANTTGNLNTASGSQALQANTTGAGNSASGYAALNDNTTGGDNTAIGSYALLANSTGSYNTASGQAALYSNTTGGDNALVQNTTGSYNTALGYNAGPDSSSPNLTNATAIGAGAVVSESNALVLGGTGSYAVNVGIGTATPQYTLDVVGNVHISGNLSKGSGSFQIDHPLDPANKYLYHSFVESPDMMDVYNGNIVTNQHGLATVVLPDYFEALNRAFRYQLTVIGQFAQAIVATEISHNHFTIKTNKPVRVSWQVTGIRHDAYADAHRIQVEETKKPEERGHYLHPELFGAPEQQAIGAHSSKPVTAAEMQLPISQTR